MLIRRVVSPRFYLHFAPLYRARRRWRLKSMRAADHRYSMENPGINAPPAELRYNVVGPCTIEQFLESGDETVDDIERTLRASGVSLATIRDVLDFGCGCGRVVRPLQRRWPGRRIVGCDADANAIDWCQQNIEGPQFILGHECPPLAFDSDSFDLVWCGSVFTHLDQEHQDLWLRELCRLLRPGGIFMASVHGPNCWEPRLPKWTIEKLKREGMLFAKSADVGEHPDWYQVAWHTEEYIRAHWSIFFQIDNYIPKGLGNYQDLLVARKSPKH